MGIFTLLYSPSFFLSFVRSFVRSVTVDKYLIGSWLQTSFVVASDLFLRSVQSVVVSHAFHDSFPSFVSCVVRNVLRRSPRDPIFFLGC